MIRAFKTSSTLQGLNVELGLLTPVEPVVTDRTVALITREPRCYILAICDWCGTREIIDDPRPNGAAYNPHTDVEVRHLFYRVMREALGWRYNDPDIYCTQKCKHAAASGGRE